MRQITGFGVKSQNPTTHDTTFADELNHFYCRFDKHDFTVPRKALNNRVLTLTETCYRIHITEDQVRRQFKRVNPIKAKGHDGISGRVLKEWHSELTPVVCELYQQSIDTHEIPEIWKSSNIVPLPKKPQPKVMNDYRPVALTPILMKCFDRILLSHLLAPVKAILDPLQFAYRADRGVDDATLTLTQYLYQHLDTIGHSARVLMIDFSSAFNTIQPHLMMEKLMSMNINPHRVLWVHAFLSRRPQRVLAGFVQSGSLTTNTGAPQGCVLSPMHSLYDLH